MLALLGAHHICHVSELRVKLTLDVGQKSASCPDSFFSLIVYLFDRGVVKPRVGPESLEERN